LVEQKTENLCVSGSSPLLGIFMISKGSTLKVMDNSGAKWSKCIKVVGKSLTGYTGSLVLVTLSNFINRKKVKKRTIYLGLIVGVKS
jgi:ribosomal protein L14